MRLPFPTGDDLPEGGLDVLQRIQASRGRVSDLFRVLAFTPKVLERREAYGKALRQDTVIHPKFRELAICTVAMLNGGGYEFSVHEKMALECGCTQQQINDLEGFEKSSLFDDHERAIIRYSSEVTTTIKVHDATWAACAAFLTKRELVELVLICAWYNQTARVTWPLELYVGNAAGAPGR